MEGAQLPNTLFTKTIIQIYKKTFNKKNFLLFIIKRKRIIFVKRYCGAFHTEFLGSSYPRFVPRLRDNQIKKNEYEKN